MVSKQACQKSINVLAQRRLLFPRTLLLGTPAAAALDKLQQGIPMKRSSQASLGLALFLSSASSYAISVPLGTDQATLDRKSTRLNSSHGYISYAVFCLKKKKN